MELKTKVKDFNVLLGDGTNKKLSELVSKKGLVIYFYPKDMTPGCTIQACDFRDNINNYKKLGYSVVGVSCDSVLSHQKFTIKENINFPLVVDDKMELANFFKVYGEKKMYGKTTKGIIRSTFIINNKLEIIKVYRNVRAKAHVEKVLIDLNELKDI